MAWKKWNLAMLGAMITSALGVAGFNYAVDPYGVFGTKNHLIQGQSLNERFTKIEFLRSNLKEFDAFVVGSSTMGLFPTTGFQASRPEHRWFNLAFLGGGPAESLNALRFLKEQGVDIKQVAFGIDLVNFREMGKASETWKREHPMVTGQSWPSWWASHLFASSLLDGGKKLMTGAKETPYIRYNVDGLGQYALARYDEEMKASPEEFVKKHHKPMPTGAAKADLIAVPERFEDLRKLVTWLSDNGVKYTTWINPMHQQSLAMCTERSIDSIKAQIFGIVGPVKDFTLRQEITSNDMSFYDDKHFSPALATTITHEVMEPTQKREALLSATNSKENRSQ